MTGVQSWQPWNTGNRAGDFASTVAGPFVPDYYLYVSIFQTYRGGFGAFRIPPCLLPPHHPRPPSLSLCRSASFVLHTELLASGSARFQWTWHIVRSLLPSVSIHSCSPHENISLSNRVLLLRAFRKLTVFTHFHLLSRVSSPFSITYHALSYPCRINQ